VSENDREPDGQVSLGDSEEPPTQHGEIPRFWLEYRGHRFDLRPGEVMIGRSAGCQIVLDDALVSRRHARLLVQDREVVLEDLGSANGVDVNGERVTGRRGLRVGDRLQVGTQELVLRAGGRTKRTLEQRRLAAETLSGVEAAAVLRAAGVRAAPLRPNEPEPESSIRADTLDLLGGVADKALAMKRGEEAERVLGPFLSNLVEGTRDGHLPDPKVADQAVAYAVKIAAVTGKARWIDYAIELFTLLQRPLPAEVVDQLYSLVRSVRGVSVNGVKLYVASLRARQGQMGPADRFLAQRIEGLERILTR
jgi:pSer/pThr/pTyr-binding forkhead associated (FHA) protein